MNRLIVDGKFIEDPAQNVNSYTFTTTQDGMVGISFRDATSSTAVWDETTSIGVYNTSEYTFSQPIDLYGRDGVQDVITAKPIKRRFAKRIFDGSDDEMWQYETATKRMITHLLASSIKKPLDNNSKIELLCSHLLNKSANETYLKKVGISVQNESGIVHIYLDENTTLAEWKAHLQANPMPVVYELAEETTEALPIADQIGLNSLLTYDGITYVEFIYDELEPTFKGKYGTSEVGAVALQACAEGCIAEIKNNLIDGTEMSDTDVETIWNEVF